MKELLKRVKLDVIISAACCIVFGVVLILWPVQVTTVACKAIGAVLAVLGAFRTLSYLLSSGEKHRINLPFGLVLLFVGIWIFVRPQSIQSMLLIGIGVALFVHGFEDFKYALETKRNGYDSWAILILLALLGMGFGAACIVNCFGVISVTLGFIGAALIYDGISALWIVSRLAKAAHMFRLAAEDAQAVEVSSGGWELSEDEE
ncbi:MAG: DUF308 domain-containing protein [Lachnospiraceae bacterium]|nr:DUF308 domain-containing protein [Lachnospiraceae bacterium]